MHNLLLIDRVPVSFFQDGLQLFMRVFDRFAPMHPVDIFRNAVHRAWAEKRDHGNQMLQFSRLHLHNPAGHPIAFQLEHAHRVPFADITVDFGVIRRNVFKVQFSAVAQFNKLAGFRHQGERDEPQKVHFQEPQVVNPVHIVLRDGLNRQVLILPGRAMQRQILGNRRVADYHPGGVGAHAADAAFHTAGGVNQLFHLLAGFVNRAQFGGLLQCFGNTGGFPLLRTRDNLRHPVHLRKRNIHHPPHVADGAARAQSTEGDNLGDFIRAVFFVAVFHHVRAPVVLKVQVNIRHSHPVRVQKALKHQFVPDGFNGSYPQREGHQRTRRGTAGVVPDIFFARVPA